MLMIVWMHIWGNKPTEFTPPELINNFISSIYVPIFFILSGYLIKIETLCIKKEIRKKTKTLLKPFVVVYFVSFIISFFLSLIGFETKHEFIWNNIGFFLLVFFGINISMQNNHYEGFYLLFLLSVFGGTIMVLCLSILNKQWLKFAAYWGKFSLVILCLHNFILIPTAKILGKFIHQSMVLVTLIILYVSFLFIIPLTSKVCPSLFNIKNNDKKI